MATLGVSAFVVVASSRAALVSECFRKVVSLCIRMGCASMAGLGSKIGTFAYHDDLVETGFDCTVDVAVVCVAHGLFRTATDSGMMINTEATDVYGIPAGGATVLGSVSGVCLSLVVVVCSF